MSNSLLLTLLLHFLAATGAYSNHQNDTPVGRFQNYLRISTALPNPNYTAPVAFLTAIAQTLNLQIQTLHFNPSKSKPLLLLLTWPGSHPSLPSLLLNSHLDSVPAEPNKWTHPPFSAHRIPEGLIFARGAQDDKCIAIRNLKAANFTPTRAVHVSLVPDEEIAGLDGAAKFAASKQFQDLNVGFILDEGQANPGDEFRDSDRTPWNLIVKAKGLPGHGSRLYDNGAMENLIKSVELMTRFREAQFDEVKAGNAAMSEVISVNPVYLKCGIASGDLIEKGPTRDFKGHPFETATDDSIPWWSVFKRAIRSAGGKLAKPEGNLQSLKFCHQLLMHNT